MPNTRTLLTFLVLLTMGLVGCQSETPAQNDPGESLPPPSVKATEAIATEAPEPPSAQVPAGEGAAPGAGRPTSAAPAGYPGSAGSDADASAERVPVPVVTAEVSGAAVGVSKGLPGDMLSASELEKARSLALGSDDVKALVANAVDRNALLATEGREAAREGQLSALLADRPTYRVLYTQRAPEKGETKRMAEVGIYRYDQAKATVAMVDLASGQVTAMDVPADFPLPVVRDEIEEAASAARKDDGVRKAATDAGLDPDAAAVNGMMTGSVDADSPCLNHRCLRLFFSTLEKPVPNFSVIVDLVTLRVVEVTAMPDKDGSAKP